MQASSVNNLSAAQPQLNDLGEVKAVVPCLALCCAALTGAISSPTMEMRLGSMAEELEDKGRERSADLRFLRRFFNMMARRECVGENGMMKTRMTLKNLFCGFVGRLSLAVVLLSSPGRILHAGVKVMISESDFLPRLGSGYYIERFDRFAAAYVNVPSPQSFVSATGEFSYSISSTSGEDLYIISPEGVGRAVSVLDSKDNLLINFAGSNVTAVGARFFMTDYEGNPATGTVTVRLSDGTSVSINSSTSSIEGLFRGFVSDTPIAWLLVKGTETQGAMQWPAFGRFYVGTSVPEPGGFALGMCGLAAFVLWHKLQRK